MDHFAPHEALELHEVMRIESIGATKMQAMLPVVKDAELQSYMRDTLRRKQERLSKMRDVARNGTA